jgi:hypothetical protein
MKMGKANAQRPLSAALSSRSGTGRNYPGTLDEFPFSMWRNGEPKIIE